MGSGGRGAHLSPAERRRQPSPAVARHHIQSPATARDHVPRLPLSGVAVGCGSEDGRAVVVLKVKVRSGRTTVLLLTTLLATAALTGCGPIYTN